MQVILSIISMTSIETLNITYSLAYYLAKIEFAPTLLVLLVCLFAPSTMLTHVPCVYLALPFTMHSM